MASTFNFQQGRYDSSYADSLANLAKDYSTIGAQQGRVAQDAINQANDLAYRNARAQAQDTQSAIQNQLSYDNLGVNKEKIAIDQFNSKAKNQASYNSLVQSGRIKGPMEDGVDYGTIFDSLNKNDITRSTIASHNASISASNANAAQSSMQTKLLQQQMNDATSLNQAIIDSYSTVEKDNNEYQNIQSELGKVNGAIKTQSDTYNNTKLKVNQLSEASKTRALSPEEQRQLDAYTRYQNAGGSIYDNTGGVSPKLLEEKAKLEANLQTTPKTIMDSTNSPEINKILQNKNLTLGSKAAFLKYQSEKENDDVTGGISGINMIGLNKLSKSSSSVFGEDSIAEQKYKRSLKEDKEINSMILNKIASANPNLPESEKETLRKLNYPGGLNKYVELNYDKDTGKLKNSPDGKQALVFKSLNDVVAKDDSDNNTTGNITQFYQSNAPTINKMSTNEINSLMELVSNNYRTQSKSSFANLGDNSPIGDSLDNAINKWNDLHPDKPLNSSAIGKYFSD